MEWKIGEIKQVNGEWYQCLYDKNNSCTYCDLYVKGRSIEICCSENKCLGNSADDKSVIFKKLKKVGEPYFFVDKIVQNYLLETEMSASPEDVFILTNNELRLIAIEIKQNKEDMEEKNLKPFDLEAAKAGKPVCTRDGHKARIICWDCNSVVGYPIIALITEENGFEFGVSYDVNGKSNDKDSYDLMMLPEKKEGWVNIYKSLAYSTKEGAMKYRNKGNDYIDTIKIEWEE